MQKAFGGMGWGIGRDGKGVGSDGVSLFAAILLIHLSSQNGWVRGVVSVCLFVGWLLGFWWGIDWKRGGFMERDGVGWDEAARFFSRGSRRTPGGGGGGFSGKEDGNGVSILD